MEVAPCALYDHVTNYTSYSITNIQKLPRNVKYLCKKLMDKYIYER